MRKSKHRETQTLKILPEAEAGWKIVDITGSTVSANACSKIGAASTGGCTRISMPNEESVCVLLGHVAMDHL